MDVDAYINDRGKSAAPYLIPSVRQLAVPDIHGDELIAAGSVVLSWYKGSRYLLSAAHVFELYPDRQYCIGTASKWVQLIGDFRVHQVPAAGRDSDPLDYAFMEVDESFADSLDGCQFLTANQLVATNDPLNFRTGSRSKYLTIGYPLNKLGFSRALRATQPKNLFFVSLLAPQTAYAKTKLLPSTHILVEFDRKQVSVAGVSQQSPKVEGLSGGGMFRMPGVERIGDVTPPRLAAITTERDKINDLMVGVRIDVILAAIDADQAVLRRPEHS